MNHSLSYVFLRAPEEDRLRVMRTTGVVRFVGTSTRYPWQVGQKEMEALRRFVDERLLIDPYPYLKAGQRVYVRSGPLAGIEGFIVRKNSKCRSDRIRRDDDAISLSRSR